jgi:division protein CdvB (Snf7/Vps24/ESCRT-III family)
MDNKINEIRRKISALRAKMLDVEASIRDQVNRDLDCTEAALALMGMRREITALIDQRNALGGYERLLNVEERLKAGYRPVGRKPLKGALARRG